MSGQYSRSGVQPYGDAFDSVSANGRSLAGGWPTTAVVEASGEITHSGR